MTKFKTGVFQGVFPGFGKSCHSAVKVNPFPNDKYRLFQTERVCRRQF